MFRTIADFEYHWAQELEATQKVFKHMTDKSLAQQVSPGGRTLGRLAWHICQSIPDSLRRMGLAVPGPDRLDPVPATSREIFRAYNETAIAALETVRKEWTDATLDIRDEMFGQMWTRGFSLAALMKHQIHHRAQMTVLMRQAGLAVPGVYGPAREEWAKIGMSEPAI